MKLNNAFRVAAIAAVAIATTMTAACGGTGTSGSGVTVTVYSADGLANWYKAQFDKITKDTGISVNLVEAGAMGRAGCPNLGTRRSCTVPRTRTTGRRPSLRRCWTRPSWDCP